MSSAEWGAWPGVLETDAPGAACFRPVPLRPTADPADATTLAGTRIWEIDCP
jgi:hypothetical protein